MKEKLLAIIEKHLPKFYYQVTDRTDCLGNSNYIKIVMAVSDHKIHGVSGQFVQVVSLMLHTAEMELDTQVFGGCGGGSIYRQPNKELRNEMYLAMKSVKIPFRKPLKREDAVLRAFEKFVIGYKQTLQDNRAVLCYQDLVNYDEVIY